MVNFSKGKNPPKEKYVKSKLKSSKQTALDLENLEKFVEYLVSLPGAHLITASQALKIYEDKSKNREFTVEELAELAETSGKSIIFRSVGEGVWLSAAEIFSLIIASLAEYSQKKQLPKALRSNNPLGPKEKFPAQSAGSNVELNYLLEACMSLSTRLSEPFFYLPASVKLRGEIELSIEDFFATCCELYGSIARGKELRARVPVVRGNFEVGKYVTDEGARKDWAQTGTNPEGFSAPRQIELARLQTWTLKPAIADLSKIAERNAS
ncbi:MAG: hypothetical protein OK457_12000, partial [Thaumarchaeota archaeon]|nr:hypothetical protein [Nitrososphaerota archaeon]